jgi:hypothetical protein
MRDSIQTSCRPKFIRHRTGIFDAMRALPPSTSEEVAKVSGLNERYIREWLGPIINQAA